MTVWPYFVCLHSSVLRNEHSAMEKLWVCATKGYSTKHTKGKRSRYSTKVVLLCWPQGRMCCHVPSKGEWRDQSILPAECHGHLGFPVVQPWKNWLLRRKTPKQPIQPYNNTLSLSVPCSCISVYLSRKVKWVHGKLVQNIKFNSHSLKFPSLDKSFEYSGVIIFFWCQKLLK